MLDFVVTPKVFTPCFGVVHVIWGTCCMFSPWIVQDGLTHGRWSMMDFHGGDGLLDDYLTSIRCWNGIFPWAFSSLDNLVDVLHCGHMESSLAWRMPYLRGRVVCILVEGMGP
jgi:hypothetical protein